LTASTGVIAGLGFRSGVLQKYADDQGGYLAASITYYAFFAVSR
jgi:hypothetical protein